jgi:hypothetical protein
MARLLSACLLVLVAFAVTAAPAPQPWGQPWEEVDPLGDCRFERDGDRLTITVPGKEHVFNVTENVLNAPRLVREVEGDFVAQVRVGGVFAPEAAKGEAAVQRAGFILTDGKRVFRVERMADLAEDQKGYHVRFTSQSVGVQGGLFEPDDRPPLDKPVYLRLERKAASVGFAWSLDGEKWKASLGWASSSLPAKMKLGPIAEASGPGKFQPEFDHFQLTHPEK